MSSILKTFAVINFISIIGLAQQVPYGKTQGLGCATIPIEWNEWRGRVIGVSEEPHEENFRSIATLDFFTQEFGHAAAPFSFAGKATNTWQDIRWGRSWGDWNASRARLEISSTQNIASEWQFRKHMRWTNPIKFTLGAGTTNCFIDLGLIGDPVQIKAFSLECLTPDATGKITRLMAVPYTLPIAWRRTFTITGQVARAGFSMKYLPQVTVKVNGQTAYEGARILTTGGVVRREITSLLRNGPNEITVSGDFNSGYGPERALTFEAFYVDERGATTMILGDRDWQWRYVKSEWKPVKVLGRINSEWQVSKQATTGSLVPMHAGALDITPREPDGSAYPVFDCGKEIAWEVKVPTALQNAKVTAQIRQWATTNTPICAEQVFKPGQCKFKPMPAGAYLVEWKLCNGEQVIDKVCTEMVVCGTVKQTFSNIQNFDECLAKKLELVQQIECVGGVSCAMGILDHSSVYAQPALNVGRVSKACGVTVRETGTRDGDYVAYPVFTPHLGEAHIAEIEYPDDITRVLRVSIDEMYPIPFCNNGWPLGGRAWPNATGAVMTGGLFPCSGKMKTMRIVFFPCTSNITIACANDLTGSRAAVHAIRIYRVRDGLPALTLPPTEREYANHCERALNFPWGCDVTPVATAYGRDLFPGAWAAAFTAAARRIEYLRYAGHNTAIEGVHMYKDIFPSARAETDNPFVEYDYTYVLAKMYKHNGIKMYAGVEFMKSHKFLTAAANATSDRQIADGTARGIYNVDKNGKQTVGCMGMGYNTLAPAVWQSITNVIDEVAERYANVASVAGLWTINGYWWLPGLTLPEGVTADDVGFDDDTCEMFERETGISLAECGRRGVERFTKRHALLTGKHRTKWFAWRAEKLRQQLETIRDIIQRRAPKWSYLAAARGSFRDDSPFKQISASRKERNEFVADGFAAAGFPTNLYHTAGDSLQFVPRTPYSHHLDVNTWGLAHSGAMQQHIKANDAVYFDPWGLNERGLRAGAAKKWWWTSEAVAVFDIKPAPPASFADCVALCSVYTPRRLFHTWLDVNLTTAHTEDARRFLHGFYSTPLDRTPVRLTSPRGITATRYANKIQLINETPYAVSNATMRIEPFGIKVIDAPCADFTFADNDAKLIRNQMATMLASQKLCTKIPSDKLTQLKKFAAADDLYGFAAACRDFEIMWPAQRFFASAPYLERQNRFAQILAQTGTARIDCGNNADCTDELGRVWLADQPYTGFGAYGHEGGTWADRGNIAIAKTKTPSIYRTESGNPSALWYHIPVTNGVYEVRLHFAETWDREPGRTMQVSVGDATRTVKPWDAGGRCCALIEKFTNIQPCGGIISIGLKGNVIINGIEVTRTGDANAAVKNTQLRYVPLIHWQSETPLTFTRDTHYEWKSNGTKFQNLARTIRMSVRHTGERGFVMLSMNNFFRLDYNVENATAAANVTWFPPNKTWFNAAQFPNGERISANVWHDIIFISDPFGRTQVFVDGDERIGTVTGKFEPSDNLNALTQSINLNLYKTSNFSDDFKFEIRSLQVFDAALPRPILGL